MIVMNVDVKLLPLNKREWKIERANSYKSKCRSGTMLNRINTNEKSNPRL